MTQDTLKHALLAARADLEGKLAVAGTPAETTAIEKEIRACKLVIDRLVEKHLGAADQGCSRILAASTEAKNWRRSMKTLGIAAGIVAGRMDRRTPDQIADILRNMIDDGLSIVAVHIKPDGDVTVDVENTEKARELCV
jgi:uncharacterized protein (DUF849 family)